jgi:antitoxin PrlF
MATSTLTSKGQITLPQVVRRTLGLEAGDKLDFVADADGGFKIVALRQDVKVLRGRFARRAAAPVSIEAMAAAIEHEAAERAKPGARRRGK